MRMIVVILVLAIFTLSACKKEEEGCGLDKDILLTEIDFHFERLEDDFFEAKTEADLIYLMEKYPEFSREFLLMSEGDDKGAIARELLQANQDSLMLDLYQEVRREFQDVELLEEELLNAFKYIKYYFPDFKAPKVYTFVSGFAADLLVTEDIIVIGLDYYLPESHKYQPPDLPSYISKRYQRPYIVPNIVTALSARYNRTDMRQHNLLAEMIYYGKAYHFTKSILPCVSDEFIIGYTSEEIASCYANEEFIWSHFVENDLFFETNPFEIRKYTGEAPSTDEISPDAPGRLGRWIGWNVVDDYRFNNKFSLEELMMEADAEKIFRQSKYKPRS